MDPISTALTAAWLEAAHRVQSERIQRLEEMIPETQVAYDERSLTDVIERGLKSGGAAPLPSSAQEQDGRCATGCASSQVDVLV